MVSPSNHIFKIGTKLVANITRIWLRFPGCCQKGDCKKSLDSDWDAVMMTRMPGSGPKFSGAGPMPMFIDEWPPLIQILVATVGATPMIGWLRLSNWVPAAPVTVIAGCCAAALFTPESKRRVKAMAVTIALL